jgi:hypothetical protein
MAAEEILVKEALRNVSESATVMPEAAAEEEKEPIEVVSPVPKPDDSHDVRHSILMVLVFFYEVR